jgi:hypothetical protein
MGAARLSFMAMPDVGFYKLCGSGTGQGFTPRPNRQVWAIRATMRLSTFARFWARVPDISAVIGQDPNVIFKIGIGEVPLLHQVTFSIWPDAASMAHFARGDGPHSRAIKSVRAENWFAEELYARFSIVDDWGTWGGQRPLAGSLNA